MDEIFAQVPFMASTPGVIASVDSYAHGSKYDERIIKAEEEKFNYSLVINCKFFGMDNAAEIELSFYAAILPTGLSTGTWRWGRDCIYLEREC